MERHSSNLVAEALQNVTAERMVTEKQQIVQCTSAEPADYDIDRYRALLRPDVRKRLEQMEAARR